MVDEEISELACLAMAESKIIYCSPCGDELYKQAVVWCPDCEEGLCDNCEETHKKLKVSKNHNVITVDEYSVISDLSIEKTCQKHDKPFDLYCRIHDSVLCVACVLSEHVTCSNDVIPLQDAAKNAKSSTAFDDIQEIIQNVLKQLQVLLEKKSKTSEQFDAHIQRVKQEIADYRVKVLKCFENLEQSLMAELAEYANKCTAEIESIGKQVEDAQKTVTRIKKQTSDLKTYGSNAQVFLETRRASKIVHKTISNVTQAISTLKRYKIKFKIQPEINSMLTSVKRLGTFETDEETLELQSIHMIHPKVEQAQVIAPTGLNPIKCSFKLSFPVIKKTTSNEPLTGCVTLLDGQILIAHYWGKKQLLLFDEDGSNVRNIPMSDKPFDVTVVSSDRVVVSYGGSRYIEYINIRTKVVLTKVKLRYFCMGVSYFGGNIYVVVDGVGIVIVELSGKVKKTLKMDVVGVYHITAVDDKIYYSDALKHTVTCCDMAGNPLWIHQNDQMRVPKALATDNDQNVFVIGGNSKNVILISPDGKSSKVLLASADGLKDPGPIYYSRYHKTLLVCDASSHKACVFNIL